MSTTQINLGYDPSRDDGIPSPRRPIVGNIVGPLTKKDGTYRGPRSLATSQLPLLSR